MCSVGVSHNFFNLHFLCDILSLSVTWISSLVKCLLEIGIELPVKYRTVKYKFQLKQRIH